MQRHLRLHTKRVNDLLVFFLSALAGCAFLGLIVSAVVQGPSNFFADALGFISPQVRMIIGYLMLLPAFWIAWIMLSASSILSYRAFSSKPYLVLREDGFSVLWRAGTKHFKWSDVESLEFSSTDSREGELLIKTRNPRPHKQFSNVLRGIFQEHGVWVVLPERNSVTPFVEVRAFLKPLGLLSSERKPMP